MFGNLTVAEGLLTEEEKIRYKACYCGLCRCLKEKYGQTGRLALNYDTTFLALLLNALYEPEEKSGYEACIAHPFTPRPWQRSRYTEYAADITIILAYLKCRDDRIDEASAVGLAGEAMLKKQYKAACASYPELTGSILSGMTELERIESSGRYLPDEAADAFGSVLGPVFAPENDRWAPCLTAFGAALGRYIYVLDAALDLEKDFMAGRYNPFRPRRGRNDNGDFFLDILKMLLGDCVAEFDKLPIVADSRILKNILCVGLWSGFVKEFSTAKGPFNESGSV